MVTCGACGGWNVTLVWADTKRYGQAFLIISKFIYIFYIR